MKKMIDISHSKFNEFIKKGYSLDSLYLLIQCYKKLDISPFEGERVKALIQGLIRKELITDNLRITEAGKELLLYFSSPVEDMSLPKRKDDEDYLLWIKTFPASDRFTFKGHTFTGDRSLRKNSNDTKKLFRAIINEGEYSCEDLVNALIAESLVKMETSIKKRDNSMSYFVNSESYLRQRRFENFIDDGKELTEDQKQVFFEAFKKKTKDKNRVSQDI